MTPVSPGSTNVEDDAVGIFIKDKNKKM